MDRISEIFKSKKPLILFATAGFPTIAESEAALELAIAAGADIRDGFVAVKGWTEQSSVTLEAFFEKMEEIGVATVICTDISRDGAMRGTNREMYRQLSETLGLQITASGGVSTMEDIESLRRMNLYGAIIGKAYYTGDIDLKKAIEAAR